MTIRMPNLPSTIAKKISNFFDDLLKGTGIWYWKQPVVDFDKVFTPVLIVAGVVFSGKAALNLGDIKAMGTSLAGYTILLVGAFVSTVIHKFWPKPADQVKKVAILDNDNLLNNLKTNFLMLQIFALLAHLIYSASPLRNWILNLEFVDAIVRFQFRLAFVIEAFISTIIALFAMLIIESLIRKRYPGITKCEVGNYLLALTIMCTATTAVIIGLW